MQNTNKSCVGSFGVRNSNSSVEQRYFEAFGTPPPKQLYRSKRYSSILASLENAIGEGDGFEAIKSHHNYEKAIELGEFTQSDAVVAGMGSPHRMSDAKLKTKDADSFIEVSSRITKARNTVNNAFLAIDSVFGAASNEVCTVSGSQRGSLTSVPATRITPKAQRGYLYRTELVKEARAAAHQYMRSRNGFALASAVRAIQEFEVSQQGSICRYVARKIDTNEARRIINIIGGGQRAQNAQSIVTVFAHPNSLSIHDRCLSEKYSELDKDACYDRLFSAATKLTRDFADLSAQGLFDVESNLRSSLKVFEDGIRAAWNGLRKLVNKLGLSGTLIAIVFISKILLLINVKLNKWAVMILIGLCNCANIANMIESVASALTDGYAESFGSNSEQMYNTFSKTAEQQGHASAQRNLYDQYVVNRRKFGMEVVPEEDFDAVVEPQGSFVRTAFSLAIMNLIGRRVPLYSKIINAQKFRVGFDEMVDGGIDAFEKLVNFILRSFSSDKVLDFKRHQTAVKRRATEVEKFCNAARGGGMKLDEAAHQTYLEFYANCSEEVTKWPRDSAEWRCATRTMDTLVKLSTDYPAHFSEASARVEPIGLMMSGDPGIGKTYLLTQMAKIISYYEQPDLEFDMARCTFQKPTGQYWEGYKGQLVLCMDDIFTKSPVAGEQESDAEMVVKLINQWPLSLNMANCALKGRFHMTSPYVLATTNLTKMGPLTKAVVDYKAIVRRFPLWYNVTLREGKRCVPGCDPDDTWEFRPADFENPGRTVEPINFSAVMRTILKERRRRLAFFNATMGDNAACKATANLIRDELDLEPQGAAMSVTTRCLRAGKKLGVCVGTAAACTYAASKVAVGVARGAARKGVEDVASRVVAVSGRVAVFAATTVLALMLALKIVKSIFKGARRDNKIQPVQVEPQARRDEIVELVQRSMFKITCDGIQCGYGLGLDDMTMVVPNHFRTTAEKRDAVLVATGHDGYRVRLKELIRYDDTLDQAFYRVKTQCKKISGTHVNAAPGEKRLLVVFPDRVVRAETTHEPLACSYADYTGGSVRLRKLYAHTAKLGKGDCGAVIMGATGRFGRRIFGMHTAGTVDPEQQYSGRFSVFRASDCVAQGGADFMGHKVIEILDYPVHNGGDTRLEPTPYQSIHGEVKTAPSLKRPRQGVDPMLKAISGYKREWGDVPSEVEHCVVAVMAEIHTCLDTYDVSPVSVWQAAAGVEGEPYSKGLARGKSPGYPFILKYKDKKNMLGSDGPYVKGDAWPELEAAVEKLRLIYKRGGKGAVFRDSLKDEPRSLEKVESASTRMISGCSVEMATLGRSQTLRYTSALMQTRHDHGMMPGFNPFSLEAGQLYDRLAYMNMKQHVTAGDYKAFDKSQHPRIMGMIWSEITEYLVQRGCDREVLEGLGRDTICARHLGGNCFVSDVIYEVEGTLPSGHWMTSLLNSMYNAVVLRYCWSKYAGLRKIYDFRKYVAAVYYGDDFLMASSDKCADFDLTFLQRTVADLGLIMTDEEGNHGGAPSKHITEATFLCRNFRIDEYGYVWMPLQLDSINDMYNWKKKSTTIEEHTEAIVRASLMEAAAHPFEVFERYNIQAKQLCKDYNVRIFELEQNSRSAYNFWRVVHKGHVPIWTPEEE